MVNEWQEHLGDMYDADSVINLLSELDPSVNLEALINNNGILALTTDSGQIVYPAFQFENGKVMDGLVEVLELLPEDLVSRWTLASWLVSEEPALHSFPITALQLGKQDEVIAIVRNWSKTLEA